MKVLCIERKMQLGTGIGKGGGDGWEAVGSCFQGGLDELYVALCLEFNDRRGSELIIYWATSSI